jgi:RNA polymerase sporulation-specific sigma factor
LQTFKKPLSPEEEARYLALVKKGNQSARNALIEYNLRLVAHVAKKYSGTGRDTDDLISAGTIGLIKAIDTFDESKGNRLAAYASRCIDNELLMMFRQERKYIREVSIYEPLGMDKEGNEISLIDILKAGDDTVTDILIKKYNISRIPDELYKVLSHREQKILIMRYGLMGSSVYTQKEVAAEMNISRSYVSRIEKAALKKLRTAFD